MHELRKRDLLKNGFEVHIDGGVRRAGDIIKAVALGATSVGIGRPFLCKVYILLPSTRLFYGMAANYHVYLIPHRRLLRLRS